MKKLELIVAFKPFTPGYDVLTMIYIFFIMYTL